MRFIYGGENYDREIEDMEPDERLRFGADAVFLDHDGEPLTGAALQRVRDRVLGTYDALPPRSGLYRPPSERQERWLLEGLWPEGTIPILGGTPKIGRSTLVVSLVGALMNSEQKFLGRYSLSPEFIYEEWMRGVVLINAENPVAGLVAALRAAIGDSEGRFLLENLEQLGGPQVFDLTVPELYDLWFHRLAECLECDGSDDYTPYVVIVDGLTAILGGTTDRYGQWYAAFRRLMRDLGIPNALVVAHNTLSGGHLMGGVEAQAGPDGLWTYEMGRGGKRRFSVRERIGGVHIDPFDVELSPEGIPVAVEARSKADTVEVGPKTTPDALVLAFVVANPSASGKAIRDAVRAPHTEVDAAVMRLVASGQVEKRPRSGQGGGFAYFPG